MQGETVQEKPDCVISNSIASGLASQDRGIFISRLKELFGNKFLSSVLGFSAYVPLASNEIFTTYKLISVSYQNQEKKRINSL